MPESRLKFISGLVGGVTALALPLAALADPPLEKFKKDEVRLAYCCMHALTTCTKPQESRKVSQPSVH